jgi:hypothetical protein
MQIRGRELASIPAADYSMRPLCDETVISRRPQLLRSARNPEQGHVPGAGCRWIASDGGHADLDGEQLRDHTPAHPGHQGRRIDGSSRWRSRTSCWSQCRNAGGGSNGGELFADVLDGVRFTDSIEVTDENTTMQDERARHLIILHPRIHDS